MSESEETAGAMFQRLSTMDGQVWAEEFSKRYGLDVDLMRAWFANAIMVGYDHGASHAQRQLFGSKEEPKTLRAIKDHAVQYVLTLQNHNVTATADQLGIDRRTVYRLKDKKPDDGA